jgi:hypothetical protein
MIDGLVHWFTACAFHLTTKTRISARFEFKVDKEGRESDIEVREAI